MEKINIHDMDGSAKVLFKKSVAFSSMMLAHVEMQPGQRVPEEGVSKHTHDEYMYVVSGEMFFSVSGKEFILHPGEALFIPRGEEHWSINQTDKAFVFIGMQIQ